MISPLFAVIIARVIKISIILFLRSMSGIPQAFYLFHSSFRLTHLLDTCIIFAIFYGIILVVVGILSAGRKKGIMPPKIIDLNGTILFLIRTPFLYFIE